MQISRATSCGAHVKPFSSKRGTILAAKQIIIDWSGAWKLVTMLAQVSGQGRAAQAKAAIADIAEILVPPGRASIIIIQIFDQSILSHPISKCPTR